MSRRVRDEDQRRGKTLVVALGGNALVERKHTLDAAPQLINVKRAVEAIAPLAHDHGLVVTHGNGPQVGLLALESSTDPVLHAPYPLDALGAETQGLIGYWLAQALGNAIHDREVVALVTQTLVETNAPAFREPSKFIGPMYSEEHAHSFAPSNGWTVKQDGTGWRRVVASPDPKSVVEIALITRLVDAGTIVVCGGGGGIPVARNTEGELVGVEAVIDKDLTSALIAEEIGADFLLLLTDVAAVKVDITDPHSEVITRATPTDLRSRHFASGSMGPKIDAVCRFVERTGRVAAIGALDDTEAILAGRAGTIISPDGVYPGRESVAR